MVSTLPISRFLLGRWWNRVRPSVKTQLFTYRELVDGVLKNRLDTLDLNLRRIDEQFENLQQQYDTHYSRYLKQFTSMMQTMQSMEQTYGLFG